MIHLHDPLQTPDVPPHVIEPCQVFIIDDDPDDQILAKHEIERSDFVKNVIIFQDGHSLTTYMHKMGFMDRSVLALTPILMLVDIEMPRKDGLQVLREIKADPFLRPIPLIVLTGTRAPEKIKQARALGADGVFRKPVKRNVLNKFFQKAWKWPPETLWMN